MKIDIEFARRDGCLDQMVPSDLRMLVSERDQLRAELAAIKAGQGEVVGDIRAMADGKQYASLLTEHMNSQHLVGAKLYAAPPATADAVLVSRYQLTRALDQLNRLGYGNISYVRELRALLAQSESKG